MNNKKNILLSFIVSIIIHLLIMIVFFSKSSYSLNTIDLTKKNKKKYSVLLNKKLQKEKIKEEKKEEIKEEIKKEENKQIVDISKPNKEIKPKDAKFYSKYDSKVKNETKAKKKFNIVTEQISNNENEIALKQKNEIQQKEVKENEKKEFNIEYSKTDNNKENIQKDGFKESEKREISKEHNNNRSKPINLNFSDYEFSKIMSSVSNDYLDGIEETDLTALNTMSYEYADYFNKLKLKVAKEWKPAMAYDINDPYRKIYGIKDRYTVLRVIIDKEGFLKSIKVHQSSNLAFLDKEAITAFEKAQPYKTVPKGLLKDKDVFSILFGFYVDNPDSPQVFYINK